VGGWGGGGHHGSSRSMATTFQSASPSSIIHKIPSTLTGLTLPCIAHIIAQSENGQHTHSISLHISTSENVHCIYQHERTDMGPGMGTGTDNTPIHQYTHIFTPWVHHTPYVHIHPHHYPHTGTYTPALLHHTYIYTRTQVQDSIFTNIQTHKYICTIRTYTPAHMYTFEYLHTHTQENHSVSSLYTQESHVCRQIDTHTYIDTHTRQTHIHTYHLIIAQAIEVVTSIYGGSLTYILRHINSPTPSPLEIDRYTHTQTDEP